ncbi:MAG: HEPN domain-containing protein [bacterium]|nr:HEPN domain-containing protein [bacterium]
MKALTNTWLKTAEADYDTASYLFEGARYPHAIYFLCQAIEKLLKAAQVEFTDLTPKKIHRLENLAHDSTLEFSDDQYDILTDLSKIYSKIRYPDIAQVSYNTKDKVNSLFESGKELRQWILGKLQNR